MTGDNHIRGFYHHNHHSLTIVGRACKDGDIVMAISSRQSFDSVVYIVVYSVVQQTTQKIPAYSGKFKGYTHAHIRTHNHVLVRLGMNCQSKLCWPKQVWLLIYGKKVRRPRLRPFAFSVGRMDVKGGSRPNRASDGTLDPRFSLSVESLFTDYVDAQPDSGKADQADQS